jgi:MoxR-like ATPase
VIQVKDVAAAGEAILTEVEKVIVGKRDALELLLVGVLANGHVLIEDFPGLAKTLIARSLAQVMGLEFRRIQFTPDLLPSDITGSSLYDQRNSEFSFQPGPSSPTCSSGMRSIARPPRPRLPCSRRCRSARSPWTASPGF